MADPSPASAELSGQVALVTGGGRGIGRGIALELAAAGARVAVAARTAAEVEETATAAGGLALACDVSERASVEDAVERTERELGPVDLLVANAGTSVSEGERAWELEPADWWRVFEVNVLGVYLCCRTVIPGMLERGRGRIVNVASGAAYLPGTTTTAYSASKAAVHRFSEALAAQLAPHGIPVFSISPGLVRTAMTSGFPDDAPWTPPELAPRLVRALASGRLDRLSGRYLHAEHDDVDDLAVRADEITARDLNAIRLRR
ncbi:MAG TPA: SDR family NAD(P)-dependent oxidoreductase [Gaiellaceae bacterium]|nr:SDR family NAD(P)-dependent oxidoreductase [Gaiellaceae bacterium]